MYKYLVAAALIVGCTLPAFAEKGFYIVRGPDKKCVVVDTAPETTVTRVGKTCTLLARRPRPTWPWSVRTNRQSRRIV